MMKPARILQPLMGCFAACVALAQQTAVPTPPGPPDEEDVPDVEEEWDFSKGRGLDPVMIERLNMLGRAHDELRYPVYRERDAKGKSALESVFESRRVSRIDETHLLFEGAVFSSFDDAKSPDTATRTVSFKEATYDLLQNLLFTDAPVKIDDRQTSINSGGMLHDRATEITIFTGGVELYLHKRPTKKEPSTASPPASGESADQPANPQSP